MKVKWEAFRNIHENIVSLIAKKNWINSEQDHKHLRGMFTNKIEVTHISEWLENMSNWMEITSLLQYTVKHVLSDR